MLDEFARTPTRVNRDPDAMKFLGTLRTILDYLELLGLTTSWID
jgi:hypothetical protein